MEESDELDIYTEKGVGDYCENDQINPSEEGFMMGYLSS